MEKTEKVAFTDHLRMNPLCFYPGQTNKAMERSREMLKENNIRPTRLRVKVLNKLISSGHSFSFTEMHHYFEKEHDRVTIYRLLILFNSSGILQKTIDTDGTARYFYSKKKKMLQPSFRCRKCGAIAILSPLPEYYNGELSKYDIDSAVLVFSGICGHCKNKKILGHSFTT